MHNVLVSLIIYSHPQFPQCKLKYGCCFLQLEVFGFKMSDFCSDCTDDILVARLIAVIELCWFNHIFDMITPNLKSKGWSHQHRRILHQFPWGLHRTPPCPSSNLLCWWNARAGIGVRQRDRQQRRPHGEGLSPLPSPFRRRPRHWHCYPQPTLPFTTWQNYQLSIWEITK